MLIRNPRRWELPETAATPESVFLNRRQLLATMGLGAGMLALQAGPASAATPIDGVFPAKRNPTYKLDRELTPEDVNAKYNNFYEFTPGKQVYAAIGDFKPFPWTVTIDGMVEEEKKLDIEKLVAAMPVEERLYRHRCVEAWSMTIPWTGFPLKALIDFARPLSSAKYVRFETFSDPGMAPELGNFLYPWPYVEGVTMEEGSNDLAFMVIGAYGKPLLGQFGAPLRLALPWKYGFKSIKSIVRITFTDERPVNFWQQLQSSEYGFWANVNPDVPHPRWSQAEERVLGSGAYVPTLLYNGYADEVAGLYKGLESEPLFM